MVGKTGRAGHGFGLSTSATSGPQRKLNRSLPNGINTPTVLPDS